MATDTKDLPAGEDLRFHFCAPMKVTCTGTWQQLKAEGFIPDGSDQPAGNLDEWHTPTKVFKLKRKARPGSGSRKVNGVDWWSLTIEDVRYGWDDVESHAQRQQQARRAAAPALAAVSRARLDRPFAAWLKAACRAA